MSHSDVAIPYSGSPEALQVFGTPETRWHFRCNVAAFEEFKYYTVTCVYSGLSVNAMSRGSAVGIATAYTTHRSVLESR
jgi:hypothetical protein